MIKQFIRHWANWRSYRQAVKQADRLRSKTFKKYFVLKMEGDFTPISKQRLKYLYSTGYFKKGVSMRQLEKMAVYTTK